MTNFATATHALIWVLAAIGAICVASWAAVATLAYREARDARHDAEDVAINHGLPLPHPDASDAEFEAWGLAALVPLFGGDAPKVLAQRRAEAFERDVLADIDHIEELTA